jgi:Polyketide cyclase / dehydrase and lipid transport
LGKIINLRKEMRNDGLCRMKRVNRRKHGVLMIKLSVVVEINALPARVLAELLDVEHWPAWTTTMTEVKLLSKKPLAVGKKAFVRQPKLRPAMWEVTELNETSFTWVTRSPGLRIEAGHAVRPGESGSQVELSLHYSGLLAPIIGRLYRDLSQRYLGIEGEGLRQRLEGGVSR